MIDDNTGILDLDLPGSPSSGEPSGAETRESAVAENGNPVSDASDLHVDEEPSDDVSAEDPQEGEGSRDGAPEVSFHQNEQKADVIYNVGVMMGATDKPLFEQLPATVIEQVEKLFVVPRAYPKSIPPDRTIVVSGPAHSGKFFCSVKLAETLRDRPALAASGGEILLYNRLRRETTPLLQSLSFLKKGSVLILEDAFEKNVSERELGSTELMRLNAVLEKRESYLILTTSAVDLKTEAPIISTRNLDLNKIFEKHLLFYLSLDKVGHKDVAELIRSRKEALAALFASPFQIEYFFQKLRMRSPRSEKEIQRLATEAVTTGRQDLRAWFDELPNHVKLIGLLACLLEGIEKSVVETTFADSIGRLRAQGFGWIADLRELGIQEAWHLLRISSDVAQVQFTQKSIRDELEWQVENRQILLWSVMQPVANEVAGKVLWREDVRARAILGAAIGWLGIWDEARFLATMEVWAHARDYLAKSPDNGLGSLPGYAFVENLLSDPVYGWSRIMKILSAWVSSHDPALMWAAGAAIWRLYHAASSMTSFAVSDGDHEARSKHLILRLQLMVRKVDSLVGLEKGSEIKRQLWNCASSALKRIGEVDTPQFLSTLSSWFNEGSKNLSWVASRAAQFTFLDLSERKVEPDSLDATAKLRLIEVVLANKSAESDAVTFMCDWLEQWLRWPAWENAIKHHLLGIATQGSSALRAALRAALARFWLGSATPGVPDLARSLIARSYAMDGVLTQSPELGRCLIIVDSELIQGRAPQKENDAEAKRKAERREGAILQILAMVEARMAVTVLLLGAQEASERANRGLRLTSDLPLHRLMRPGIQSIAPDGVGMVLLLTAGPVIDLEDGLDAVHADHKLVISVNCDLEVPLGTELLRIGRDLSARDLDTIETKLRLICARAQAALDPAGWEPLLERLGANVANLDADPEAALAGWAAQLGDIPGDTTGHDPAKKILCALNRLAAADLDACLRIVRTWLTDGTDMERPMAAATAVALLRAVTDAPGIWGGLAPQRTFDELAGPLARSGKDGTDAMLETVKRWLAEPALAEVLAGAVEDGRCRLLRWAEEAAPQQVAAFQEALKPLRKSLEAAELGPSGEVLDAVFDRLRVRLAMGRPRPLPALAAGETFGVIVIDASARWGQLAADLFSRFNQPPTSLKPLLYRLGERWPSWVAGDPNPKPADLSPVGVWLPRLLGPILNELSPAAVSFLVVLSGEMWIDGEDWIDSPWRERIFTFRQLPDAPFRPVLAAFPHRPDQEKAEVDLMELVLKKQPMGSAEEAA